MKVNDNNYKNVLDAFQLIDFWEEELRVNNDKRNQTALRVLDQIGDNVPGSIITRRVHTNNPEIRKQAKSLSIKYATYDALRFLEDDFDRNFNTLDKVKIHASLKESNKHKTLPSLMRWVNSAKNENYKIFLIEEIGFFKQQNAAPLLLEMFKDESLSFEVRAQIVKTLGELEFKKAVPVFIEQYEFNHQKIQENIIEALGKLKSEDSLQFLEKVYEESRDRNMMINILRSVRDNDETGLALTELKRKADSPFEKEAINFVRAGEFPTSKRIGTSKV